MESDRELVDRVLAGDRDAFAALVERHRRLVARVVGRLVDDARDREEVAQDVFLKVYRGLPDFRHEASLSTWIARIAYHTAINRLRGEDREIRAADLEGPDGGHGAEAGPLATVADDAPGPAEEMERRRLKRRVRETVRDLRPEYRAAVTLYHLEGMSVGQVSEAMELPEGTVKSHLYRARRELKERLLATGAGDVPPGEVQG